MINSDLIKTIIEELPNCVTSGMVEAITSGGQRFVDYIYDEIFDSNIDYLYKLTKEVEAVRSLSKEDMFKDALFFSSASELDTDMVIFYSREIRRLYCNDDLAMMFIESIEKNYKKSVFFAIHSIKLKTNSPVKRIDCETDFSENEVKNITDIARDRVGSSFVFGETEIPTGEKYGKKGCVYIVKNNQSGKVKIGKSIDPELRIKNIKNISGSSTDILFVSKPMYGYSELETELHKRYSDDRRIGEWFAIKDIDQLLGAVNELVDNTPQPKDIDVNNESLVRSYNLKLFTRQAFTHNSIV